MATYTRYIDLQSGADGTGGHDGTTFAKAWLTLNYATLQAAAGDVVTFEITSTTTRTGQSVYPAATTHDGCSFTFRADPVNNLLGKWYAEYDANTRFILLNAVLGATVIVRDLDFSDTADKNVSEKIGDSSSLEFHDCTIGSTGAGDLVAGAGTPTAGTITMRGTAAAVGRAIFAGSARLTAFDIQDCDLTGAATANHQIGGSSNNKITSFIMKRSKVAVSATMGAGYHVLDLTQNNATEITIENNEFAVANANGGHVLYLPDSGAAACAVSIRNNNFHFTGTGSATSVVQIGSMVSTDTRANIYAAMNHNFSSIKIEGNTLRNTHATGSLLHLGIGATNAEVSRNLCVASAAGTHVFEIVADGASVHHNIVIGSGFYVFGNSITAKNNTYVSTGTVSALIGAPAGTTWETLVGGEVSHNIFMVLGAGYAFSDYMYSLGAYTMTTVVKDNLYFAGQANKSNINSVACGTIAAARTQWSVLSMADNDLGSKIAAGAYGPLWLPFVDQQQGARDDGWPEGQLDCHGRRKQDIGCIGAVYPVDRDSLLSFATE